VFANDSLTVWEIIAQSDEWKQLVRQCQRENTIACYDERDMTELQGILSHHP
jgi:hypothetical protein